MRSTRASRRSPARAASEIEPAKPFSTVPYTKSGATPCSRATPRASAPSRSVTMNRPGMAAAATPALYAGTSCGARSDDVAGDDVVGVSAQAASTPATANADASRLTEIRDIDGILPGYVLHIHSVKWTEKFDTASSLRRAEGAGQSAAMCSKE